MIMLVIRVTSINQNYVDNNNDNDDDFDALVELQLIKISFKQIKLMMMMTTKL